MSKVNGSKTMQVKLDFYGMLLKNACMGVSTNPEMVFNLESLVAAVPDLEELTLPFPQSEIDDTVRKMPTDKAPGPDGFNGLFMKRCW